MGYTSVRVSTELLPELSKLFEVSTALDSFVIIIRTPRYGTASIVNFSRLFFKFLRCLKLRCFTIQTNIRARLCGVNKIFPTMKTSKSSFVLLESWTTAMKRKSTIFAWSAPKPRRKLRLSDTMAPTVVYASTSETVFMLAAVRNSSFPRSRTRCGAMIPVSLVIVASRRYFSTKLKHKAWWCALYFSSILLILSRQITS
jgi:hypothetical protein